METVLDIEADVKNETGYVFYKLYKVSGGPVEPASLLHCTQSTGIKTAATLCGPLHLCNSVWWRGNCVVSSTQSLPCAISNRQERVRNCHCA